MPQNERSYRGLGTALFTFLLFVFSSTTKSSFPVFFFLFVQVEMVPSTSLPIVQVRSHSVLADDEFSVVVDRLYWPSVIVLHNRYVTIDVRGKL